MAVRIRGANLAPRPRHPDKDIERILRAAEKQGWRVFKNRYYRILCPCPDEHMKSVHLTPSNLY